ncbi:MAG: insulinase family protein [Bacteroides sp.]|nr:insulinase family protein [Bacillota bacterium]MCM1393995.1 insulinase family protein [[Eubacterium] siraeum]MCM1455650.1 insulinase family protein [Bacteroides sp.]
MQKLIEFESGLKLVLVQNTAVRSVALGVFVGAGVVKETPEIAGISHFIEHMVFKGTKTRSSFDIVNEIDSIGAQINAFTSKSYTCFYTVSIDTNVGKCADVLSDMYFNPLFDGEELARERRVVIEEINESEDTPDDVCTERLLSAFFKDNPLEKPILGSKKTLEKMTSATLKNYHDKYYTAANTVISIAGNISEKSAIELVKRHFESKFSRKDSTARVELEKADSHSIFTKKKKQIEQAHVAFAFPAYAYDDDRAVAVQLLSVIFSMEMSSRLFQSVREKLGLCYTVIGYPSSYENNGAYIIYTATNPENVEKAVRAIRGEIDLLLEKGVTDAELNKGKEQLKTSLVLGQESTSAMMRTFGSHAVQTGKLYDFDARISAIDNTGKDDILNAARHIFDLSKACGSIVSPADGVDVLKILKS